jgi:uncharacterized protein
MYVQALWRYPVKSMRGERLTEATLQKSGMQGDRNIVVVSESRNNIVTARTHPRFAGPPGIGQRERRHYRRRASLVLI